MQTEVVEELDQATGLKMQVLEEIVALAQKYNVKKVILFGSRARGDYTRASDIDLAISGGDKVRFRLDVEEDVRTLLTFDVVDLDRAIDSSLMQSIEREGKILYEEVR